MIAIPQGHSLPGTARQRSRGVDLRSKELIQRVQLSDWINNSEESASKNWGMGQRAPVDSRGQPGVEGRISGWGMTPRPCIYLMATYKGLWKGNQNGVSFAELSKTEPGGHWGRVTYEYPSLGRIYSFDHVVSWQRHQEHLPETQDVYQTLNPNTTHDGLSLKDEKIFSFCVRRQSQGFCLYNPPDGFFSSEHFFSFVFPKWQFLRPPSKALLCSP